MARILLFFALLGISQEEPRITLTLREVLEAGKPPTLLCEGTTTLPDRSRIEVWLFFGEPGKGPEMGRDAVEVRDGRFSHEFAIYSPPRNLVGLHSARVSFEPHLQKQVVLDRMAVKDRAFGAEARLQAGTPEEADRERRSWGRKLLAEIDAMAAIADTEAEGRYVRDREAGKHDQKAWDQFVKEAEERTHEILHRVIQVPEYKALRFGEGSEVGLEELREYTMHYIRSCVRVLNHPADPHGKEVLREGWRHLKRSRQRATWAVFPPQGDAKKLTAMGEDVLRILRESLEADEAGGARARRRFREAIIELDNQAPGTFHESIIRIIDDAAPFFEALGTGPEKARPLLEPLSREIQEILEDFKKLK